MNWAAARRLVLAVAMGAMSQLLGLNAKATAALWNQGWVFHLGDTAQNAPDDGWDKVVLPHTPRIEQPMEAGHHFQGVCWYHKHFRTEPGWRGKKIQLRFDGAMQMAEVWLNGQSLAVHEGGYLPFTVNLTPELNWKGDNVITVRLVNRDQPDVPPGKPLKNLDFTYQGGLYRDVHLIVTDPLHITDVFEANRIAGGGLFVRTESADATNAAFLLQADVQNDLPAAAAAQVLFTILDAQNRMVATAGTAAETISAGDHLAFTAKVVVARPQLWHPDHPFLYTLKAELRRGRKMLQAEKTRFGLRTLAYDDQRGFVINGESLTIRGANRHQDFPWLGNAVPDNAQYRDLKRLKDAGFNFLRLAHYPQSQAVMDACDELGLMVSVCTPGWQWFKADETFTDLAKQNIRDMVRWHRNHPSAIMWEVSLNETYGHDQFYAECARIAREEYPGGQLFTAGDSYASKDVSHYDVPYAGWGGFYERGAAPGFEARKRSFAREYGDYEFGGEHSTTRVAVGAGETALLLQAWNFIWSHNRNAAMPWLIGDCLWVGVDHFRGCSEQNPISRCGVLDYLRRPKFSYSFFQSQRDVNQPAIFIANYWTPRSSPTKVVVFSNCEEVELRVNGKTVARRKPDAGPDSDYGVWHPEADPVYMASGKNVRDDEAATANSLKQQKGEEYRAMFDGGNARHMAHPPFTFAPVPYEAGELKAVGYVRGKQVCEFVRRTPGVPVALKLEVETCGRDLTADGTDAVFVRARIVDKDGQTVPTAESLVTFSVDGAGRMVSPAEVKAEAGVATLLLQAAGRAGKAKISARAGGLTDALLVVRSK
ncbi:MAG TPA: glycoside hydrolase family 2 TIM barrel-domain containing protein [Verrucomicrobiae bacterium]|nr:glycoside hydrolase family 2 TIM barrel-domain containing protein [Verrucomicrobiae bacterium]